MTPGQKAVALSMAAEIREQAEREYELTAQNFALNPTRPVADHLIGRIDALVAARETQRAVAEWGVQE